jgi:hypothetical protein
MSKKQKTVLVLLSGIKWDTDGQDVDLPTDLVVEVDNDGNDWGEDAVDKASDMSGWCISGVETISSVPPEDRKPGTLGYLRTMLLGLALRPNDTPIKVEAKPGSNEWAALGEIKISTFENPKRGGFSNFEDTSGRHIPKWSVLIGSKGQPIQD